MAAFSLSRNDLDGWVVLTVAGEVDLATAPTLRQHFADLVAAGVTRLVLDLGPTTFLDSTGLGAIVMVLKRLRAHDGALRVVATSPSIRKVFEITSLDRVLAIHATVDEAVAA